MTDSRILTDDDGNPVGVVDIDQLQSRATLLGFRLAAMASADTDTIDQCLAAELAEIGTEAFGPVCAAALRHLVVNVLDPVLDVTDQCRDAGALSHDLRAGLRDALANAEASIGGDADE